MSQKWENKQNKTHKTIQTIGTIDQDHAKMKDM